jgi:hypothetical protein
VYSRLPRLRGADYPWSYLENGQKLGVPILCWSLDDRLFGPRGGLFASLLWWWMETGKFLGELNIVSLQSVIISGSLGELFGVLFWRWTRTWKFIGENMVLPMDWLQPYGELYTLYFKRGYKLVISRRANFGRRTICQSLMCYLTRFYLKYSCGSSIAYYPWFVLWIVHECIDSLKRRDNE